MCLLYSQRNVCVSKFYIYDTEQLRVYVVHKLFINKVTSKLFVIVELSQDRIYMHIQCKKLILINILCINLLIILIYYVPIH